MWVEDGVDEVDKVVDMLTLGCQLRGEENDLVVVLLVILAVDVRIGEIVSCFRVEDVDPVGVALVVDLVGRAHAYPVIAF